MPLGRAYTPDLTVHNPADVVYIGGTDLNTESWRLRVQSGVPDDQLEIEHHETLTEIGITLDEAKVATVEAFGYTDEITYYASVAADTRVSFTATGGINGDMIGRVIEFNGFLWMNHDNEWIEKANLKHSMFSDRGIFQRMNVIDTDPDDNTKYPPAPSEGTALGARNTAPDGSGAEHLSITSKDGVFGMLPAVVHGSTGIPVTANQAVGLRADGFPVTFSYNPAFLSNVPLVYTKGQVVTDQGIRYVCNTTGVQDGLFPDFADLWDAELVLPNFSRILTSANHEVLMNENGDVMFLKGVN